MQRHYRTLILLMALLLITGCQSRFETGISPTQTEMVSKTPFTSSENTITATADQASVNIITPTPVALQPGHLPKTSISIDNAASLKQVDIIGNQYTYLPQGFRTVLSPTFDTYAMVENPEATHKQLVFSLRDVTSGAILHTITGDAGKEFSAKFSPDGRFFAVGNDQGMLSVWEVKTGASIIHSQIEKFQSLSGYSRWIDSITFSNNGNLLCTTSYAGRVLALWNIRSGKRSRALYCYAGDGCSPLAFSPDGKYLVTVEKDYIILLDGKTGTYLRRFVPRSIWAVTNLAFSPRGDLIAVMDTSLAISIYKFPQGILVASFTPDKDLLIDGTAMSFSPDGKILATGYLRGSYVLWDVASSRAVFTYTGANYKWHDDLGNYSLVFALSFSPDGTMLAAESEDNSVTLWAVP